MRNLRAIYNKAVDKGIAARKDNSLFYSVFTGVFETRRRALEKKDMVGLHQLSRNVLENKMSDNASREKNDLLKEDRIRYSVLYFMFSYHARGMSFIDLAFLRKSDIVNNILRYKRKKTGGYIELKVTSPMRDILTFFLKVNPDSKYIFPIIEEHKKTRESNMKMG